MIGRWLLRARAVLVLFVRFAIAVVVSGVTTLRIILSEQPGARACFVRVQFAPLSETGVTLLGALVTLTPGATAIDIDLQRRELTLHLLDGSDPQAVAAQIRRDFEPHLVTLFGSSAP